VVYVSTLKLTNVHLRRASLIGYAADEKVFPMNFSTAVGVNFLQIRRGGAPGEPCTRYMSPNAAAADTCHVGNEITLRTRALSNPIPEPDCVIVCLQGRLQSAGGVIQEQLVL
jgi:hypothetical protein